MRLNNTPNEQRLGRGMNHIIREAGIADIEALAELKLTTFRQTFLEGFAIPYPPADLALFEAESYGLPRIEAELADPSHRTWVAEADGRLLAYAHVGPCKLPHEDVRPGDAELYQLYLREEAQGVGLGKRLLDLALLPHGDLAAPVWLGVWSGNTKAQALYQRRGFRQVGTYGFRVGTWFDEEYIYKRI